ncbi:PEP-CTERM sorting domain-containing protein [Roseateles toxinivorans]|uniref:Putative secreted protein with PEP-CTERM sorting signal n=1 Tax=Roseateles toxinivorans TaxID=270368 RepID=A0A4V3CTY3_9BURK|nr:PEP-CTERM sorting domain-containing protein [Roseateles toxinivorans]TDP74598.1 putative secreted protein with PEP-CTERM sorting signal [Roseateles toxinivorans]
MKLFKKVLTAVSFAAAMASSHAAIVNVGGVSWDPDAANDFTAQFNFAQQFLGNPLVVGTALQGFGEFYGINNTFLDPNNDVGNSGAFCNSCELTLKFGGLLTSAAAGGGFTADPGTGVYLEIFVDAARNYKSTDQLNAATATDGQLWLRLKARNFNFVSDDPSAANPFVSGQLTVNWDVDLTAAALATDHFDTNARASLTDVFSRASSTFVTGLEALDGNGTVFGNTIPEPESLALVGLALVGAAAAGRRKQAK